MYEKPFEWTLKRWFVRKMSRLQKKTKHFTMAKAVFITKSKQQIKWSKSKGRHIKKYNYTEIEVVFSKFLFIPKWPLIQAGTKDHIHKGMAQKSSLAPDYSKAMKTLFPTLKNKKKGQMRRKDKQRQIWELGRQGKLCKTNTLANSEGPNISPSSMKKAIMQHKIISINSEIKDYQWPWPSLIPVSEQKMFTRRKL